jgi:hypothetical protein
MHPLCGADAINLSVAAVGLRNMLPVLPRGMAHLVAMLCKPLFLRNLCWTFHAAFVGSFFCGVRLGGFLRRSAWIRCSFLLR